MAAKKQKQSDEVTVTLAHPLRAVYAVRLGLDERDYEVEEDVTLRRDNAKSLANAGYVADVDPNDEGAVEQTIGTDPVDPSATQGNK